MMRNMMITWFLLVSLICKSSQDGNGQENGVLNCGPQNLTLSVGRDQMILSAWEDNPSCSAVRDVLTYQLEVLIAGNQVHYEEVAVTPDQVGSTHSWNWTSHVALECGPHSVRLTSRYGNRTSPWVQRTLPGTENSTDIEVFPRDRAFKFGSTVTFCCVLPAGEVFPKMQYNNADMKIDKISNQIYTMTVNLTHSSRTSSTDTTCSTNKKHGGASNFIGYPPFDEDLKCETRDLESIECQWTVGNETRISLKYPTTYHLLGRPCANGKEARCSQKVQVDVGEKNWTVTAENKLGKVELSDTADLTKRVHMFAPTEMTFPTVNARNVTLEWKWRVQRYNNLSITCQVNVSQGETQTISGVGLHSAVLDNLIPNWPYEVKVRCGTTQDFWRWSDWSSVNFHTRGDVPDALDVWMKVKDNQTIITWKMLLANQSHGDIKDYEVTWAKTGEMEQPYRTKVSNKTRFILDATEDYIVMVTARNMNGSSSPSTITIPSLSPESSDGARRVNTTRITGRNGGFDLFWSASPAASCGYIVDWCPTTSTECEVEWLKVPPNETSAVIRSEQLRDGVRYSLSVYACTQGAPVLLERREGYVNEGSIEYRLFKLEVNQRNSDLEVSWESVDLRNQPAFIEGYALSCWDDNNKIVHVSTGDPEATILTARNLKTGSYNCTVKARMSDGECCAASIAATMNSPIDDLIKPIIISLVTVFGLLSLITVLCYRLWPGIKRKIYPPIPTPVLSDKWMTSPGENNCHRLCVDHHNNEIDILDVSEVPRQQGQANDYISQEGVSSFSQTPAAPAYYNLQPNNFIPSTSTVYTAVIPSNLGVPSSLVRGVFPNPSYNLMVQTGDEQSSSGPELQGGATLESSPGGYQPQSYVGTIAVNQTEEDQQSPMPCDSTYILLPKSTSK